MSEPEWVFIDEHRVRASEADRFFDGKTGERLTDEQWDESKRRREADNIALVPKEFRR
jgi:hypothetical protein